jgi:hypothetical protein
MNSKTTGAILAAAVSVFWADARAAESERNHADPATGSTLATEAVTDQNILEAPGPPADGTGTMLVDRVARGVRDGAPGMYFVSFLFDYIDGDLVNVDNRVHFVPDPRGAQRDR